MAPKYNLVKEYVPPETYTAEGDQAISRVDPLLIVTIDQICEFFGVPAILNNWHNGGPFKYRVFRPEACLVGAKRSMHKLGKAADFNIPGLSAQSTRLQIIEHASFFPHIRRMEDDDGVERVHIDLMETGKTGIVIFKP